MNNATTASAGHRLVLSRGFKAPLELVWAAWTEPSRVKEWLGLGDGSMTVGTVSLDLRTGGKFRFQMRMEDGEYYTAAGTYLVVKERERLIYTWDWEKDGSEPDFGELEGNETLVTVTFAPLGEQRTQVTLTHEKFATEKSRDMHTHGWTSWLDKVAIYITTQD